MKSAVQSHSNPIKFYTTGKPYDIFSNVTRADIEFVVNGERLHAHSSEAIYQGLKAYVLKRPKQGKRLIETHQLGGKLQRRGQAFAKARVYHQSFNGGNRLVKEQLMFELLLCKFTQNERFLKALLETHNRPLIENTQIARYNDSFWGNGHSGKGRNALGQCLMRVRALLNKELTDHGHIKVREGLSASVCKHLNIKSHPISQKTISKAHLDQVRPCLVAQNNLMPPPNTLPKAPPKASRSVHSSRKTRSTGGWQWATTLFRWIGKCLKSFVQTLLSLLPQCVQNGIRRLLGTSNPQTKTSSPLPTFPLTTSATALNTKSSTHSPMDLFHKLQRGEFHQKGNINYGIDAKTGVLHLRGLDKHNQPIHVSIQHNGDLLENGRRVPESGWTKWAVRKISSR